MKTPKLFAIGIILIMILLQIIIAIFMVKGLIWAGVPKWFAMVVLFLFIVVSGDYGHRGRT